MDVSSALLFWHFFCAGSLKTLLQGCEHRCINWLYSNTQCSCTPVNVISWYNFHMETLLLYFFIFVGHPIYYIFWKVELAQITVSNQDHVLLWSPQFPQGRTFDGNDLNCSRVPSCAGTSTFEDIWWLQVHQSSPHSLPLRQSFHFQKVLNHFERPVCWRSAPYSFLTNVIFKLF